MNKSREAVRTLDAPQAIGPYSQAIRFGDLLFVSGVIPIDPITGELVTGNFEAEVKLVLESLKAIIEAAGMDMRNVLKTSVFLRDMAQFAVFNGIYAGYFGEDPPARETVQPARLPRDASIEISAICGKQDFSGR